MVSKSFKGLIAAPMTGFNPDGSVNHDLNAPGNWDAAKMIKAQGLRRIWTVLPDVNSSRL